jgi:uncharacterized protein (DUF2252 family)
VQGGAQEQAQPQTSTVYDLIQNAYAPLMSPEDPLGFAMKVRNLSANSYRFWRGAKEPFYEWCKTNPIVQGWLKDADARIVIHGDLHPGNIGIYASQGKFGKEVALGAVDFDETTKLPFQMELLQGVITFELLARQRSIPLTDAEERELVETLLRTYRATLESDQSVGELLAEQPWVAKMLRDAEKDKYKEEVEKYVEGDRFVERVVDKQGKVKEVLREAKGKGNIASAVEDALLHTPDGKDLFKDADIKKKSVEDIARRNQLEAAGSEGLNKFLVLLKRKKGPNHLILYLKEQVPSSAERSGVAEKDPRPAGKRSSDDMHLLCNPPAYFNSWCDMEGRSYRVSIKEPWSESLESSDLRTPFDLQQMAGVWGVVAASMHRQQKDKIPAIKGRLTPELAGQLRELAGAYAEIAEKQFEQFAADRRTREQISKAEGELRGLLGR